MDRFSVSLRGLAALAVVCAFASLGAASASAAPLLWSLNASKGTVSSFETGTDQPVGAPIATGAGPNSIAITPNGRRALVTNFGGESVTVIDTATRTPVATVPLPTHAERVAISPDGRTAYVTVEGDEHVFLVNPESNASSTTGSFPVGPEAFAVAFAPGGRYAYIGIAPEAVQAIETGTGTLVGAPLKVGGFPEAIVFTPNGKTAYVSAGNEVAVIDTALGQVTGHLAVGAKASGLAVTPDGRRLYATAPEAGTVTAFETATNIAAGPSLNVGGEPQEVAISPDGKTAYVGVHGLERITPITIATNMPGTPLTFTGSEVGRLVVAPDQSPTAVFTPPTMPVGYSSIFDGSASTDPDGSIALWGWTFGEGDLGSGPIVAHGYDVAGAHNVTLSLVDNEGCGEAEVFTGRTAYCSGGASTVTHPVQVDPPPARCSAKFAIGGVSHNRGNGTVRLRLRFPTTGWFLLFGKKIHVVTRKVRKPGTATVTLHARVELNKRLKKILRAHVRFRITFTPSAGCGSKTVHRSVALLRAPHHRHHR